MVKKQSVKPLKTKRESAPDDDRKSTKKAKKSLRDDSEQWTKKVKAPLISKKPPGGIKKTALKAEAKKKIKKNLISDDGIFEDISLAKKVKKLIAETKEAKLSTKTKKNVSKESKASTKEKKNDKTTGVNIKPKKIKVKKNVPEDPLQQCAEKFKISLETFKSAIEGLLKVTTKKRGAENTLFSDEDFPVSVQVNTIKVPKHHSKIIRIPLKHSLLTADSEICFIVADVKGIKNKDHELHLGHYDKLFREKGIDNMIKKVMTFHEFRTEYETYEMKSRLVELYDFFLTDGKICGKVVKKCGKIFYKKRKVPSAIKMQASKLREHVEKTLTKTPLYWHAKGDSFYVQFGHSGMPEGKLVENLCSLLEGLEKSMPGGFANVRSLNLFAPKGINIPIYVTLKNQNEVSVPDKEEKKEDDIILSRAAMFE